MHLSDLLLVYSDLPEFVEIVPVGVSTIGNFGNTPLHVAAARGVVEELRVLLDSGADVNAVGELGNTPLHDAVGQSMPDAAKLLVAAGADILARNDFGDAAVDIALKLGNTEVLDMLNEYSSRLRGEAGGPRRMP